LRGRLAGHAAGLSERLSRQYLGLSAPVKAIDEKCLHTGGIYADKRLALWRLADIAA
jgi:hypothetical protein